MAVAAAEATLSLAVSLSVCLSSWAFVHLAVCLLCGFIATAATCCNLPLVATVAAAAAVALNFTPTMSARYNE